VLYTDYSSLHTWQSTLAVLTLCQSIADRNYFRTDSFVVRIGLTQGFSLDFGKLLTMKMKGRGHSFYTRFNKCLHAYP